VESPPTRSAPGDQVLSGARQGPSLQWEGGKEGISPLQEGKLTSKGNSPNRENEAYEGRLGTCPERQDH
jgi:hypothetical protein